MRPHFASSWLQIAEREWVVACRSSVTAPVSEMRRAATLLARVTIFACWARSVLGIF